MAKRAFDLGLACLLLLVLGPLMLAIAVAVRIALGSPVLFRQWRPGLNAEPFRLMKFRTMTDGCGEGGEPLADAQRLTAFGRLLRRTSLDELPELINVLRGEMSMVGPRPLLMDYLSLYSPEQARRHEVRPGITGWAQVNGRNAVSWGEKFSYDLWYVENHSLLLDIRILWKTLIKVFQAEGITEPGSATAGRFRGNGP
jgi:sugar transferase EpsL